jgi:hypothetical protein
VVVDGECASAPAKNETGPTTAPFRSSHAADVIDVADDVSA